MITPPSLGRHWDITREERVLVATGDSIGPRSIRFRGRDYNRYLDCLYVRGRLSQLDPDLIEEVSVLRLVHADRTILRRTTLLSVDVLLRRALPAGRSSAVLDFGCGAGTVLDVTGPTSERIASVVGVDRCAGAIELARRTAAADASGRFVRSALGTIPARDSCFDAAIANFVMHFAIPKADLEEIRRVLKPGGRFVYNDYRWVRDRKHTIAMMSELTRIGFQVTAHAVSLPGLTDLQTVAVCTKPVDSN